MGLRRRRRRSLDLRRVRRFLPVLGRAPSVVLNGGVEYTGKSAIAEVEKLF